MMIVFLGILILPFAVAYNNQCSMATTVDLTVRGEYTTTEDTSSSPASAFRLTKGIQRQPGKWYRIRTDGTGNNIEVDTCLSGQTNFDTKIYVMSRCMKGVGSGLLTSNDDSLSSCGTAARVIFNDKGKKEFYVFVTGSKAKDVGVFGLRIVKQPPLTNTKCSKAIEVNQFPAYQEGSTTGIPPNYNALSGLFYRIKGNGKRIHVGTCHRATNVDTLITVFDNCAAMNPIITENQQCSDGSMGSKLHIDSKIGMEYYIHIASSPKKRGQFIAFFENEDMVVPMTCEKATAINFIPFAKTTKLDGVTQSMSCGNTLQKVGAWYTIVGDGYDYIFYTCNSKNGPQDGTMIEIFESCNSNSKCEMNDNGCGLHGKIAKRLEQNKNYFIKVSCTNPHSQCSVTLNVDKLNTQGDINSCVFAKTIEIDDSENVLTDSFDISRAHPTQTHCGGVKKMKGVWYKVVNNKKKPFPLFVQASILYASSTRHTAEIQMYRTCALECEEHQYSVAHLSLKPKETVMFFVTTNDDEGQLTVYFREDYRPSHDTCKTALEFNAPFSIVEYKSNLGQKTQPVCAGNVVGRHTGIYYYFQSPVTDTMVVETCGLETQFDTYVEVFQGCGSDSTCVLGNDDSPECGSTASYVKFEAQQGAEYYIYVSEASKAADTEGTFRLNVYTLNPPTHSTCQRAEPLTPGLAQHALTKYAHASVSTCNINDKTSINSLLYGGFSNKYQSNSHLLGVWYKYQAQTHGKLYISTCNAATSVRTRIGIYRTCGVKDEVSIPDQCIIENSVTHQACSTRGTYASTEMKAGETVFIFVGGETPNDVGFVAVESEFQSEAPNYKRVVYTTRIGPRRMKERRTAWLLWAFWWFFYAAICIIAFGVLSYFGKKDDFLGYHEL